MEGGTVDDDSLFEVSGTVWQWRPDEAAGSGWYFLTVDGQTAAEIRYAALGRTNGFGSIRVTAAIGGTRWQTSLFPHRETGGFVLPLKADVRKREGIEAGGNVIVQLKV